MIAIVAGPPCSTKRLPQTLRRLQRGDRLLGELEQPPLGSHLITPRRGFAHHGIYVGGSKVVHYKSVVCHLRRLPVAEVSLANFAQGRAIWVRGHGQPRFDGTEVTRRARSRLGEDRYRILSNNCEHFCEWCLRDEHRSYQVERLLTLPQRLLRICSEAIARLRMTARWSDQPACSALSPQLQHLTRSRQSSIGSALRIRGLLCDRRSRRAD